MPFFRVIRRGFACKCGLTTSYGIDAIRSDGRGGYNLGMIFPYNFGPTTFAFDRALEELRNARVPIRSL